MTFIFSLLIFSLVSLQYSRSETMSNSSSPNLVMSQLSGPTNDFGLRFVEQINSNNGGPKNVLFSPLSAILAYGMLLEGATGETEKQIKSVLKLSSIGNQTSDVSDASKKLLESYKLVEDGPDFSLAIGNLAMINQKAKLKEAYAQILSSKYFAQATSEDFVNGTAVMNKLNAWIADKTKGKIEKLLTSPPDEETILMLVNSIYFKGRWEEPFPKGLTIDDTFTNADSTLSKVKMMVIRDKKFNFFHNPDKKVKIVELPYHGNVSMYFILPTESNTLAALVPTLNATVLDDLMDSMISLKLRLVSIPKFKLEDTLKLHEILPSMGMDRPFGDLAELGNIAEGAALKVSQSIQKAFLEVDEEGSVAAATTLITTVLRMSYFPAEDFIADRPFLFIIRDKLTGVNLFMGQMNKMANMETAAKAEPSATPTTSEPISAPTTVDSVSNLTVPTNETTS